MTNPTQANSPPNQAGGTQATAAPTATTGSPNRKSLLNQPSEFNGDKKEFKGWLRQLLTYIRDPKNGITTDDERIDIAMSYMRGGTVTDWVQNYYDTHFDEILESWSVSWMEFKAALIDAFTNKGQALMAQEKLEAIQQGSDSADDFFKKFKALLTNAGYDKDAPYVIRLIEKAVDAKTIDQIYGSRMTRIDDYKTYKSTIISIDEMWRRRKEQKKGGGHRGWGQWNGNQQTTKSTNTPQTTTAKPPHTPQTQGDRKDGTGTTFGGTGRPMDLDAARRQGQCFNCGERGHISRECPKKKNRFQQVRGLSVEMTDEERLQLATEWGFIPAPQ